MELWAAKLMCRVVLLSFLNVLLKAELMLYAVLRLRCARLILGLSCVPWCRVYCFSFCVGVIVYDQDGAFVICYSDAVVKEQVVTLSQLL